MKTKSHNEWIDIIIGLFLLKEIKSNEEKKEGEGK